MSHPSPTSDSVAVGFLGANRFEFPRVSCPNRDNDVNEQTNKQINKQTKQTATALTIRTTDYTGVLPFDAIVASIRIFIDKTLCWLLGFLAVCKKANLAVCLTFWFELHARWLDWCQI